LSANTCILGTKHAQKGKHKRTLPVFEKKLGDWTKNQKSPLMNHFKDGQKSIALCLKRTLKSSCFSANVLL
jgi:hypothetical protein